MSGQQVREFLLPTLAERDPRFVAEIERLGRRALRAIGWVEIVMPVLGAATYHWFVHPIGDSDFHYSLIVSSILPGIATRASAETRWGSQYAREVATLSGIISTGGSILIGIDLASLGMVSSVNGGNSVLIVLVVGLALLPLKPWHAIVLGGASTILYRFLISLALARQWIQPEHVIFEDFVGLPLMVLLCTALAGSNYQRLADGWLSQQRALEASDELRRSETRTLIVESAASMGRLAAAISHEINSPLGAMNSAASSLGTTAQRLVAAEEPDRRRLSKIVAALSDTVAQSAERMQAIIGRMQRFTNLDRAEVQMVDMKQLLADVAALVAAQSGDQARIRAELGELPAFPCRPQQLSAVFSSLLHHAVSHAGADGDVRITANWREPHLEISVTDSGPALTAADFSRLFDPEFRVSGNRVSTGDWNLFGARQLLREVGGDIHGADIAGGGNTYLVSLPCPVEPR